MRTFAILVTLVWIATLAQAIEPSCDDFPPNYQTLWIDTAAGTHYVANDPCQFHSCLLSIWFYEESNGIHGLQRCDTAYCSNCPPDTLVG